jgi:hypothetical protein
MPSAAYGSWVSVRARALDELVATHGVVGGTGPGRRHALSQLNAAYATLLSAHFQGFCRDLHTEASQFLIANSDTRLALVLTRALTANRKLDKGNPNPGNLGNDFNYLGMQFWTTVSSLPGYRATDKAALELLNTWRNALAHQDFTDVAPDTTLRLVTVKGWRSACNRLARDFDAAVRVHVNGLVGSSPW